MPAEQKETITPEEEIADLERRLEAKKREIASKKEGIPEEKELFREVVREHIEAARPALGERAGVSIPAQKPAGAGAKTKADIDKEKERERQIKALIEIALVKSISEAVRIAGSTSPYLLDELHDHLADDLYDKLIALRKIKKL